MKLTILTLLLTLTLITYTHSSPITRPLCSTDLDTQANLCALSDAKHVIRDALVAGTSAATVGRGWKVLGYSGDCYLYGRSAHGSSTESY